MVTEYETAAGYRREYTYNAEGLIASVQEGKETAELKYDDTGRIVEKKDREGTIRYSYDKNGNVLSVS
ncbi:MAG: hypothetical protein E7294_10815 [Lachnospiraceae bacterium]|nr:hypothetical protein [Lachnospiraceae bacterium]